MSIALNASSFASPDFIIPTWLLGDVSEALESTSHWATDRMQEQMVATLLSTVFLGAYTLCVAYAARILTGRGPTGARKTLLLVTLAMYLATSVSWLALVVNQFRTFRTLARNLSEIYSWIPPADCFFRQDEALPEYCTAVPAEASHQLVGEWPATAECVGTFTLAFNVAVGDAIVWWRVWVLWNKRRPLLVLSCLVLLATLVSGALDSSVSCSGSTFAAFLGYANGAAQGAPKDGSFFQLSVFGAVVIALSLFSNTVATLLVGYKAWTHRRSTKAHFAGVPSVVRVQRALMLLLECGIAYTVIWVAYLRIRLAAVLSSQESGHTPFSYGTQYFSEGCLLALVGMYPTLIVVLVALDKSEIEKQSHAAWAWSTSVPVVRAVVPPPRPPGRKAATDASRSGVTRTGGDEGLCTRSVVPIGMPPSSSSAQLSDVASEDGAKGRGARRADLTAVDISIRVGED